MQLLLFVQAASPDDVPFMDGETYAILPTLLVPRILMPNKPASHEGTYLLNIHYGIQTRDDTAKTTIGFGLLNEAFANFGYIGIASRSSRHTQFTITRRASGGSRSTHRAKLS